MNKLFACITLILFFNMIRDPNIESAKDILVTNNVSTTQIDNNHEPFGDNRDNYAVVIFKAIRHSELQCTAFSFVCGTLISVNNITQPLVL